MCLNMMAPKLPRPEALPPSPTPVNAESLRIREEQRRRLRARQGTTATQLSGRLGDVNYGFNIGRATVLGGTTA